MEHSYLDEYSHISSFIHNLEPRVKILAFFTIILFTAFVYGNNFIALAMVGLLVLVLITLSKIPLVFFFKKTVSLLPFILMVALSLPFIKPYSPGTAKLSLGLIKLPIAYNNIMLFFYITAKACLSIMTMTLLMESMDFSKLLKALEKLKAPLVFIMIISFMYRYIFVLEDELMKMRLAKDSRTIGGSKWFHIRAQANMLGVLFIRAYERAEKVYLAMCSRGFDGRIRTVYDFKLRPKDILFFIAIIGILLALKILLR